MNVPQIVTPPNPVGVDKVINLLQHVIAGASYLDTDGTTPKLWFDDGLIFPNTRKDETTGEPILFWKGNDYFKTIPEQTFGSMAFFYETDPRTFIAGDFALYQLNLVVWFTETHFAHGLEYRIREFFINTILQELFTVLDDSDIDATTVITTPENVFADFELQIENPLFKSPNDGFRISFTYNAQTDCGDLWTVPS